MYLELFFFGVILPFAFVALFMGMEHSFSAHFLKKHSFLRRCATRLSQRYPVLCDDDDTFYCFFRRDAFHRR